MGSSVVEGFVTGHTHSDVLRELVQNEFDAGGSKLLATFGVDGLTITGNGKPIDRRGWDRLSVILGTGKVIGAGEGSRQVPPKANGIGSKNFGLRSLFLFGNRIYVRSAGRLVAMDLPEVGSQSASDPDSRGQRGVTIYVPYRTERFSKLEAFTVEREQSALDDMASELLRTLVKLALPGPRSLRNVFVDSQRTGRRLAWHQRATSVRCQLPAVVGIRRSARLVDAQTDSDTQHANRLDEIEFQRKVAIPVEYGNVEFPGYFRANAGSLRIGVSLPVRGNRIDLSRHGRFYYPLGSRAGSTGTTVSVNAPFEMDDDRTMPIDSRWNHWLSTEAVRLTMNLLQSEWLKRFGGDAYLCVRRRFEASPAWFMDAIEKDLKTAPCWPVRTVTKSPAFKEASEIVVPADEALDSFLSDERYLDSRLARVKDVQTMARDFGARQFSLNSLVHLRCASKGSPQLTTKLQPQEANFVFESYQPALSNLERQIRMASALTKLSRHLSNPNRKDLKETQSTLAADGSLQKASDLHVIDPDIEDVCPVPLFQRLHPNLREFQAIAKVCQPFEIGAWMRQVAERLDSGIARDAEREALYRYLLGHGATIDRIALAHIRKRPVVRDHRGEWTAPTELVSRRAVHFNALEPVLHAPSRELERAKELLRRLKVRKNVTGQNLVAYAAHVVKNPSLADGFEQTLTRSLSLLVPKTVNQLQQISFLRSSAGGLVSPARVHLRTPPNLACLDSEDGLVGEGNMQLYRRLKCQAIPSATALLGALSRWRGRGHGPRQPEAFYPILVVSLLRERSTPSALRNKPILWVDGRYVPPDEVLVGPEIPRCFHSILPQIRGPEALCKAYEALGAHRSPAERHWRDLVIWFGSRYEEEGASPPTEERRALIDTYRRLGGLGLPDGVPDTTRFLLSRDGTVHSVADLREGRYVENDYPDLADAIRHHQADLAFADLSEETRRFLTGLGLKTLTAACGAVNVEIGQKRSQPSWFLDKHETRLLERVHKPEFMDALLELAWAFKRRGGKLELPGRTALESRVRQIVHISFVAAIYRMYRVGDVDVPVAVRVAPVDDRVVLVSATSLQEIDRLLAFALAELLGATTVEVARSLALLVSPLLQCRSTAEAKAFLREQGISWSAKGAQQESGQSEEDASEAAGPEEDMSERMVRQLLSGLENPTTSEPSDTGRPPAQSPTSPTPPITPDPGPEPTRLPTIDQVNVTVLERTTSWTAPTPGTGGGGGEGGSWSAPGPRDLERDREIGMRGEEIVYRLELARLRALGHVSPEQLVRWTSQANAGADHDIRSVAEDGKPLWIEVKSTTGTDGRFDWSKKEFQKALREGDHYELWRIYEAATECPSARRFRDPVALFGEEALKLDIGSLRAVVEPMQVESGTAASSMFAQGDEPGAK